MKLFYVKKVLFSYGPETFMNALKTIKECTNYILQKCVLTKTHICEIIMMI